MDRELSFQNIGYKSPSLGCNLEVKTSATVCSANMGAMLGNMLMEKDDSARGNGENEGRTKRKQKVVTLRGLCQRRCVHCQRRDKAPAVVPPKDGGVENVIERTIATRKQKKPMAEIEDIESWDTNKEVMAKKTKEKGKKKLVARDKDTEVVDLPASSEEEFTALKEVKID